MCVFPGVWSPGQKSETRPPPLDFSQVTLERKNENGENIPPVWTPRSAGASPTVERKGFRPVPFDSPTLERKHRQPQPKVEVSVCTS